MSSPSPSTTRIVQLAASIGDNTASLDGYLSAQHLATPSFDPDAPVKYDLPDHVAAARQTLLEDTDELHALLLGPIGQLTYPSHNFLTVFQAIVRFNIATSFPTDKEEATYAEIGRNCGLDEAAVRRIIRYAMTMHVFRESRPGIVAHTAASKMLASNPLMRHYLQALTEEMWPAAVRTVDAMAKWPGSQEPNQCGFSLAHGTDKPIFAAMAEDGARARRFGDGMSLFTTSAGFEPEHIVANYPWGELGHATVVDVGGSHGVIMAAVAERFPSVRCIIQDRPEVVKDGPSRVAAHLRDRVTFMEHDFFTEQPVKHADVYFFRWIFHDWSDTYSIKILRALIPALKTGARIVVSEFLVPEPHTVSKYVARTIRSFDHTMLELENGKEREPEDWSRLFQEADGRFKVTMIKQPPRSKLGLIEITWEG